MRGEELCRGGHDQRREHVAERGDLSANHSRENEEQRPDDDERPAQPPDAVQEIGNAGEKRISESRSPGRLQPPRTRRCREHIPRAPVRRSPAGFARALVGDEQAQPPGGAEGPPIGVRRPGDRSADRAARDIRGDSHGASVHQTGLRLGHHRRRLIGFERSTRDDLGAHLERFDGAGRAGLHGDGERQQDQARDQKQR